MKNISRNGWIAVVLALTVGLILGYLFFKNGENEEHAHPVAEEVKATTWTCSMHPQIKAQEPGQCPICGMDLIPLSKGTDHKDNPMAVKMSATAAKLANIQTMEVGKENAKKSIRLNGKVVPNERMVKTQSSHVDGRIEELLVNTTGEEVKAGQKLASIYSPELITAQQELLQVLEIKSEQPALYKASVEKLKSMKVSQNQISEIEKTGEIQENIGIYADRSGIVLTKKVNVGDYLKKGEALFTIADLSKVWVVFDAYEGDLGFIKEEDELSFTVASLPGKSFTGKVTFVNPTVDPQTRVTKVRVEIENESGKLKPEMFANATVQSRLGESGEMILPKTAVMWTGERSVVYVYDGNEEEPSYELREVVLGPALGNAYSINSGIEVGERVVVNGTFTVDAAAQLAGKPSMMNLEGGAAVTGHHHGKDMSSEEEKSEMKTIDMEVSEQTKKEISEVLQSYFKLKDALVTSDKGLAVKAAEDMMGKVDKVKMGEMSRMGHSTWMDALPVLRSLFTKFTDKANIDVQRKAFVRLSEQMVVVAETFGPFDKPIYVLSCPMADNNKGADWLSATDEVMNPYYGDMMLKCGDVKKKID